MRREIQNIYETNEQGYAREGPCLTYLGGCFGQLTVSSALTDIFVFECWDYDQTSPPDLIGSVRTTLAGTFSMGARCRDVEGVPLRLGLEKSDLEFHSDS